MTVSNALPEGVVTTANLIRAVLLNCDHAFAELPYGSELDYQDVAAGIRNISEYRSIHQIFANERMAEQLTDDIRAALWFAVLFHPEPDHRNAAALTLCRRHENEFTQLLEHIHQRIEETKGHGKWLLQQARLIFALLLAEPAAETRQTPLAA